MRRRGDVRQLGMNANASLLEAARSLLDEKPGDREAVPKRYEAALDKDGDGRITSRT